MAVGGGSVGPGFLGMTYAPFVVGSDGNVRNLHMDMAEDRLQQRMAMLGQIESASSARSVPRDRRNRDLAKASGSAADHAKVLKKTLELMTSKQMDAFKAATGADRSAGALRQDRLRPRLLDGPPAGRAGRAVRRSRPGRLGHAHRTTSSAAEHASCPSSTRP